ncbi:MAG TPA: hypothetical protein P5234_01740 [Thermoanaerobaculaceae bacterium]|nr:hypothetical protein [Thermoanaerobaculaceae bacterium]HRS14949.1 hypothetical protein [Thermoanaerobaculaceae bacterium]
MGLRSATRTFGAGLGLFVASSAFAASSAVSMETSEAEAVLAILNKQAAGEEVGDADWRALFDSRPYVRLKARESAMKRAFSDEEFRAFVRSPELVARARELREALDRWKAFDLAAPVARASAYLSPGTALRATIYPVIKPKTNSFVFEVDTDPAIFMYLDPADSPEKLANTLAHELHHIGFGTLCPAPDIAEAIASMPDRVAWVVTRLGAFGEGLAMLAAAGGPDEHPHAVSSQPVRERWDRDVSRVAEDMKLLERFMFDASAGKLSPEDRQARFFSFFGEQGPWYTVGWLMASTIERELGRDVLIAAFCDPRQLLGTFNRAAISANGRGGAPLPLWSDDTLRLARGTPAE